MSSKSENFIDEFSKSIAGSVSRRDALKAMGSAVLGGILASSGFGRERAATSTCPACGTCQTCDLDAKTCQPSCSPACTTATLCGQAQSDANYIKLQQYLLTRGFRVDSEPRSLIGKSANFTAPRITLTTNYLKRPFRIFNRRQDFETATLYYSKGSQTAASGSAFVVVELGGAVVAINYVNDQGQVDTTPRWKQTAAVASQTPAAATSAAPALAAAGVPSAASKSIVQAAPQSAAFINISCQGTCETVCNFASGGGPCKAMAGIVCAAPPLVLTGVGYFACVIAMNAICSKVTNPISEPTCTDACASLGVCKCQYLDQMSCTTQCCNPGEMCCNDGTCKPDFTCCPSGEKTCPSGTCCPNALKCCGSQCIPNNIACCGPGEIECGGKCIANNCPVGYALNSTTCRCECSGGQVSCNNQCVNSCPAGQGLDPSTCNCINCSSLNYVLCQGRCIPNCPGPYLIVDPNTCACRCSENSYPCGNGCCQLVESCCVNANGSPNCSGRYPRGGCTCQTADCDPGTTSCIQNGYRICSTGSYPSCGIWICPNDKQCGPYYSNCI